MNSDVHQIKRGTEYVFTYRFGRTIFYKQQMLLLCKKVPNSRERLSTVNKLWKSLQPEEKQRYKMQASEEVVRYSMELQNWFEV